ncbi:MAG: BRCT domain-containing protein, partial [Gemmataceae bacterium]
LRDSPRDWPQRLNYKEDLADTVLKWMGDPGRFAPADLGLAWLLELVARSEPRYHEFGVETLIRSFTPADLAPRGDDRVEFIGVTFAFAGKTAQQPREQYEELVRHNGGTLWNMISPNLHYLVIGDDGSALLGQGPKGSRQQKAEELNAAGANIAILTEAALVELLAPKPAAGDATQAGCERLWRMAITPGPADSPIASFARKYLLARHPEFAAEENRKLAEGAEVPREFYSFARVKSLFFETRRPLRDFALELARREFARWSPAAEDLIKLCEAPQHAVRAFVAEALLAEDSPENRRFRIDPGKLSAAAVFSFCESLEESTRELGMQLIRRSPALHTPDLLFNLLESPDRKVRSFAIRLLWSLYRDRGITAGWKPTPRPEKETKKKQKVDPGPGAPVRPEQVPIDLEHLRESLRRVLFELPGSRPPPEHPDQEITFRLKALSTREAKLSMIEVIRDLALEEFDFARIVQPVLEEFIGSRGQSEKHACLVAVTRIRHAHIELRGSEEAAS